MFYFLIFIRIFFSVFIAVSSSDLFARQLHEAIKNGKNSAAYRLIDQGANLDVADEINGRPIFYAIALGELKLVSYLIEKGANLTLRAFPENLTVLEYACSFPNLNIVKVLIENGASLTEGTYSPLYLASERGYTSIVRFLLKEKKVRVHGKGKNVPIVAASYNGHGNVIDVLIDHGAHFKKKDRKGITVLMIASRRGKIWAIDTLLKRGSRIEARDSKGKTALHHAIENKRYYAVRSLLKQKANPLAKDKKKMTAWDKAKKTKIKRLIQLVKKYLPKEQHLSQSP